jgi:hypothetical protein
MMKREHGEDAQIDFSKLDKNTMLELKTALAGEG